ncbi:MAG: tetratricopeptide repeat protein [Ardenticatenaceae bacterium]
MEISWSDNSSYSDLFRSYIVRSTQYILTRVELATFSLPTRDHKLVLHTLNYALEVTDGWAVTRNLLVRAAPLMEQAGYRDEWMFYLNWGMKASKQQEDIETQAHLHFYIGVLHQHQADFGQARCEFSCSAAQFEKIGDSRYQARALNRLAFVARCQRRFEEAKRIVEMALALSVDAKEEQAYAYLVLGSIAFDQRDWQNARDLFSKSLFLSKQTNNMRQTAWGLTNLGTVWRGLNNYQEAISCYKEAIELLEQIQDPVNKAVARMNLGNVYLELNEYLQAIELYSFAESIFRKTQEWLRVVKVNYNQGVAYDNLQQWHQAGNAYSSCIEQARRIGMISSVVKGMIGLGQIYQKQKLYDQAAKIFQDALNELRQIEDEPNYEDLLSRVNRHLEELRNSGEISPST